MVARPLICAFPSQKFKIHQQNNAISTTEVILLQKPPKPSNIKFHYIITDQSSVRFKIAAEYEHVLKLDFKILSLEEGHVWGMGSLE